MHVGSVTILSARRSILCKSGQSITVYGESNFDGSVFAFDEVLGEGFEGVGGGAEGFEGGEGVGDEFLGVFEGLVDAEDGGPGGFGGGGVFAGGLAEFGGGLGHVEDVVDDLEGEAGFFAEGAEAGDGIVSASRCAMFGYREMSVAEAEEAAGDDAGGDEGSGFCAVDGFDEFGGGCDAFGFDVHDLSADHAGREFGFEIADAAYAGADGERDFAEDGYGGGGWGGKCGDGLEGEGLEGVAGEDGGGFAEDDVAGGLAAAEVVVVEGGEVVVDEGVGVEHLEGCAEVGCACGDFVSAGDHAGGFHAEDGAEAFAAGEDAVAHGAVDGVREGVGRGQKAFEGCIGELGAGVEQGFYVGIHLMLMINAGQGVGE